MDFQLQPVYPKRVWRNFQGHRMDSKLGPASSPSPLYLLQPRAWNVYVKFG